MINFNNERLEFIRKKYDLKMREHFGEDACCILSKNGEISFSLGQFAGTYVIKLPNQNIEEFVESEFKNFIL